MALDTEMRLNEMQQSMPLAAFRHSKSINSALEEMIRDKVKLAPRIIVLPLVKILSKLPKQVSQWLGFFDWGVDREFAGYGLLSKGNRKLQFTTNQLNQEGCILKNLLLEKNKYFCISLRDGAFHSNRVGSSLEDYRNVDITAFSEIIKGLEQENFKFVQLGRKSFNKLKLRNVIRYDETNHVSDLADLILLKNSLGLINSGDGISAVANVLDVPVLYINHSPWEIFCTFSKKNWIIPSIYKNYLTGRISTISEIMFGDFPRLNEKLFSNRGLRLSPIDLGMVEDCIHEFCENQVLDCAITSLHRTELERFWREYKNSLPNFAKLYHPDIQAIIPLNFLRKYGAQILNKSPNSIINK